ncbi:8399_t:CDS:2, partial [Gigaspora rosea]
KKNYNRKGNYEVVLKCLNNSEKMDSNCLNELKNFLICKNSHHLANYASTIHQYYDLVELMNRCWESDPAKRHLDADPAKSYLNTTNIFLDIKSRFFNLIDKAKRGEIKFPENMDAKASPTEINEQAIYS